MVTPALAQAQTPKFAPPPRTISDITAILDREKPDAAKAAKVRAEATAAGDKISGVTVTIERKVGEEDRLFGSVTTKDIVAALKEKGIELDRKGIELASPIRAAGTFDVTAKLLGDITATFKVEVVPKK